MRLQQCYVILLALAGVRAQPCGLPLAGFNGWTVPSTSSLSPTRLGVLAASRMSTGALCTGPQVNLFQDFTVSFSAAMTNAIDAGGDVFFFRWASGPTDSAVVLHDYPLNAGGLYTVACTACGCGAQSPTAFTRDAALSYAVDIVVAFDALAGALAVNVTDRTPSSRAYGATQALRAPACPPSALAPGALQFYGWGGGLCLRAYSHQLCLHARRRALPRGGLLRPRGLRARPLPRGLLLPPRRHCPPAVPRRLLLCRGRRLLHAVRAGHLLPAAQCQRVRKVRGWHLWRRARAGLPSLQRQLQRAGWLWLPRGRQCQRCSAVPRGVLLPGGHPRARTALRPGQLFCRPWRGSVHAVPRGGLLRGGGGGGAALRPRHGLRTAGAGGAAALLLECEHCGRAWRCQPLCRRRCRCRHILPPLGRDPCGGRGARGGLCEPQNEGAGPGHWLGVHACWQRRCCIG